MYNCAAIRETTRTTGNHWYFALRAIFILWTGSLQQHDISRVPGHMVLWPRLPGVTVARETKTKVYRRWGKVLRMGCLESAELCWNPTCSTSIPVLPIYMCGTCYIYTFVWLHFLRLTSIILMKGLCANCDCPLCALACMPIVDGHVRARVPVCFCSAASREGINLAL